LGGRPAIVRLIFLVVFFALVAKSAIMCSSSDLPFSIRAPSERKLTRFVGLQSHSILGNQALILAATLGGPTMFARIGVMQALNRHVERVFDTSRKPHHWGKRKLKRDE
jgi:hypothetical protein